MAEIERHAFFMIANGGGLDSSPKSWSALLFGAAPIIRKSALVLVYDHLPVVVKYWTADAMSSRGLSR